MCLTVIFFLPSFETDGSAYMWVAVDDSMLVHHFRKDLKQRLANPFWRNPQLLKTFEVIDFDAVYEFHGQNFSGRQIPVDLRDVKVRAILEPFLCGLAIPV